MRRITAAKHHVTRYFLNKHTLNPDALWFLRNRIDPSKFTELKKALPTDGSSWNSATGRFQDLTLSGPVGPLPRRSRGVTGSARTHGPSLNAAWDRPQSTERAGRRAKGRTGAGNRGGKRKKDRSTRSSPAVRKQIWR